MDKDKDMNMDEIIAGLSSSMAVSENNTHDEHPHYSSYKNEGKVSDSQRTRRANHLERQTKAREVCLNRIRSLYDESYNEDDDLPPMDEDKDINVCKSTLIADDFEVGPRSWSDLADSAKQPKKKRKNIFADYLMFSEWLVDIPDVGTLSTEWVMLPCPTGKRVLVVSMKGSTTAYNKAGHQMGRYQTDLPGGNANSADGCTMLDCIYVKDGINAKFYVLDLLCWNNQPFSDAEFSCRRFFLQSRLEDTPELAANERCSFRSLPSCPCTVVEMTELMKLDFEFPLDGLLFYYTKVFYSPGQTPLVGWLKPWMLKEILNVDLSDTILHAQGDNASAAQFIEKFNEKHHFKSSIKPQTPEGN